MCVGTCCQQASVSHNTVQRETFEGENFREFCGFVVICESFLRKIWDVVLFGAAKVSTSRISHFLPQKFPTIRCVRLERSVQELTVSDMLVEKCHAVGCTHKIGLLKYSMYGTPSFNVVPRLFPCANKNLFFVLQATESWAGPGNETTSFQFRV